MKAHALGNALASVDWNQNSATFIGEGARLDRVHASNLRLAIWSKQFEVADAENPALCFIRAMQLDGYDCTVLTSLALYKPAAGSMRAMVESALYYSYFRSHPTELATLVRNADSYVQKADVIEHHGKHTPGFREAQEALGFVSRLNEWYKCVSAIMHGQIPGTRVEHSALGKIKHVTRILESVVSEFEAAEDLVHRLFLCTAGKALWVDFSLPAKKKLLKGLDGDTRMVLGLTLA